MDFDDSPEEVAFRAEARAWLEQSATPRSPASIATRSTWRDPSPEAQAAHVARCRQWQQKLADDGWAGITWPRAYGGRGGTPMQQVIFNQEQQKFDVSTGALTVGLAMVGPTLMAWGTDEQKERFLGPMLRGEELWCQLFSEPGAGSDLAGLSCRAHEADGGWVVNGQKVWTSLAQHSQWAILLARTNAAAPKHRGIAYFLLDMTTPGIDVRPLRQIDGVAHFNEVFLTDVRIPSNRIVGEVDDGWSVARTTLQSERVAIGSGDGLRFDDLRALASGIDEHRSRLRYRQDIAAAFTRYEILRYLGYRVQTAVSQGRAAGAESSVMKLAFSQHIASTTDLTLNLLGAAGALGSPAAPDGGFWQQQFLSQWSTRIGGGTDQIQRNILAERVLGLPREPSSDRDAPFDQARADAR
jgi:alkylation response protein AidB-like acyl-CoA dehydrogenase